jgi:hypothetical protein
MNRPHPRISLFCGATRSNRFQQPLVCFFGAVLLKSLHEWLQSPVTPLLTVLVYCFWLLGFGLFVLRLLDWWGEEAPVWYRGRFSWVTHQQAIVRMKLIELLGDARLARREVRILMARYPGRSEQWCWEFAVQEWQSKLGLKRQA